MGGGRSKQRWRMRLTGGGRDRGRENICVGANYINNINVLVQFTRSTISKEATNGNVSKMKCLNCDWLTLIVNEMDPYQYQHIFHIDAAYRFQAHSKIR